MPLRHTRTYCDPRRPAIRLPGPHGSLRYEFMLRAGDRDEEVLDETNFRRWIARARARGRRAAAGAQGDLRLPRAVATRWKQGRVLLAGDAAH